MGIQHANETKIFCGTLNLKTNENKIRQHLKIYFSTNFQKKDSNYDKEIGNKASTLFLICSIFRNSTTPNEVKKPRISDSGEGCFKALEQKEAKIAKKELAEEEDDHESLLKAN
ncbi:hypothetical protein BpHYR1_009592 [Brachionus plicatilis]|uniref:Uncharacterized protein n=1 Tax=Brachionus plicatilis TaxID=10195 RepID=A0A3M7T5E1_BRAPC|nr:hypothetical protein BpHYR1_009592 [Brachionus plicatilis]